MSTYVNPRPQPVRVKLSDGSQRIVGAWGLAFFPDSLYMISAEYADELTRHEVETRRPRVALSHRRAA
jgi:hypothetical protein